MTALVMSSEVDLAIERILSDRNATSSSTTADVDSDVTNTSEEGLITSVFGKSVAIHSPASIVESESMMDFKESMESRSLVGDAGKRPGGGDSDQQKERKEKVAEVVKSVFDNLIEDAILGLVFEAHRAAKTGLFLLYDSTDAEDDEEFRIISEEQAVDVFGQALISTSKTSKALSQLECICPQCHQSRLACRFAPHLEKCMGMGRNSSRLASRRLAATAAAASNVSNAVVSRRNDGMTFNGGDSSDEGDGEDDHIGNDDDDDDDDWTMGGSGSGGGGGAFGKKRSQRKRGTGVGSTRTPKKRGSGVRVSPKKPSGLRSGGSSAALIGDVLFNEAPKGESVKKMRKTSSYGKFPIGASSSSQQSYDFGMESGVNDFLAMPDTYDPPSPSF